MKLYSLFRSFFHLPRPNEIWGDEVENRWSIFTLYAYLKLIISRATSHVGIVLGTSGFIVSVSTWVIVSGFEIGIFGNVVFLAVFTFLFLTLVGHLDVSTGFMKKENTLANSQNKEITEIKETTKKILDIVSKK